MKKKLFINGEWIESANYNAVYSPYSEEVIAEIPMATEEETESAIANAHEKINQLPNSPPNMLMKVGYAMDLKRLK